MRAETVGYVAGAVILVLLAAVLATMGAVEVWGLIDRPRSRRIVGHLTLVGMVAFVVAMIAGFVVASR